MVFTLPEGLILTGTAASPHGRSMTATRAFKPGDVIGIFTSPSIAIPDSPSLATTCSGCLAPAASEIGPTQPVRACVGCRTVAYCSLECQRLDWKTGGHKAECKVFKRVKDEGHHYLPTPVRALVHVLLRPELRSAMADLEGHFDKFTMSGELWKEMELQVAGALHYLGHAYNKENIIEAIKILCKLQVNSFSRLDMDIGQTGLYMNPALSMLNHSCIPNAFVQFIGKNAVLHAYQDIQKNEKIEISYIDFGSPLSTRQNTLKTRYHFTCECPRCKDDMYPYQVCRQYPHLNLNSFSLVPDIEKRLSDDQTVTPDEKKLLSATIEEIYPWCSTPLLDVHDAGKMKQLRRRWAACKQLRRSPGTAAIQPLPSVLTEASIVLCEQGKYSYGLCISCFLAIEVDPFILPAPFAPRRLKRVYMIAKLLTNNPADQDKMPDEDTAVKSSKDLWGRVSQVLHNTVQVTICQLLLELVLYYAPAAHSKEWSVYREAKAMLSEIEALEGREVENALVKSFLHGHNRAEERKFYDLIVLRPLRELSAFCLEIMDNQFGS
ncbi:SET domain-containing protein [Xylaria nigripes]|nr:SET domain-containing protein [Xylaria nigripes]